MDGIDSSIIMLWNNSTSVYDVKVSDDGKYMVAGDNSGRLSYFNNSRATTGERSAPTWTSKCLFGSVEKGTLGMPYEIRYVA